jgi:Xaa-Pro aminopeptidase
VTRGFPDAEFAARLSRAQAQMAQQDLAALLLTQEADLRYFSGFLTRFWESPTRPWFLIVPQAGKPIAVIPSIGAALMRQTWVEDIRDWRAPVPGDDGVSLLTDTLNEVAGAGRIGTPMGMESQLRMPLADWHAVTARLAGEVVPDDGLVAGLRAVKSAAEIAKIEAACAIAGRAFARVPEIAREGVPLDRVFRDFQRLALEEGADWVPYLAGGAGPGGYADVISPATEAALARGDVLMLDTGLVRDGYFCDFDRNYAVGQVMPAVEDAHARLIEAVDAAVGMLRPGVTASQVFAVMDQIVTGGAGSSEAGRLGHGLGMQLTEGLSLIPDDRTELRPGMVITLEPGIETGAGRVLVHEEVVVLTDVGCRFLSPRAGPEMVLL